MVVLIELFAVHLIVVKHAVPDVYLAAWLRVLSEVLASIHTCLSRLVARKELRCAKVGKRKKYWLVSDEQTSCLVAMLMTS